MSRYSLDEVQAMQQAVKATYEYHRSLVNKLNEQTLESQEKQTLTDIASDELSRSGLDDDEPNEYGRLLDGV